METRTNAWTHTHVDTVAESIWSLLSVQLYNVWHKDWGSLNFEVIYPTHRCTTQWLKQFEVIHCPTRPCTRQWLMPSKVIHLSNSPMYEWLKRFEVIHLSNSSMHDTMTEAVWSHSSVHLSNASHNARSGLRSPIFCSNSPLHHTMAEALAAFNLKLAVESSYKCDISVGM